MFEVLFKGAEADFRAHVDVVPRSGEVLKTPFGTHMAVHKVIHEIPWGRRPDHSVVGDIEQQSRIVVTLKPL